MQWLKWPCLQSLSREPVVRLDELQGRRAASTILWGIAVYFVTTRFSSFPAVKASRARQGKAKLRVASMGRSSTFSLVFYICAKQLLSNLAFYFFCFFSFLLKAHQTQIASGTVTRFPPSPQQQKALVVPLCVWTTADGDFHPKTHVQPLRSRGYSR